MAATTPLTDRFAAAFFAAACCPRTTRPSAGFLAAFGFVHCRNRYLLWCRFPAIALRGTVVPDDRVIVFGYVRGLILADTAFSWAGPIFVAVTATCPWSNISAPGCVFQSVIFGTGDHSLVFVSVFKEVGHVQKSVTVEADVHKSRLHSRQDLGDASFIDITGDDLRPPPFNQEFDEFAILNDGNSRFLRYGGNNQFFLHQDSWAKHRRHTGVHRDADARTRNSGLM